MTTKPAEIMIILEPTPDQSSLLNKEILDKSPSEILAKIIHAFNATLYLLTNQISTGI